MVGRAYVIGTRTKNANRILERRVLQDRLLGRPWIYNTYVIRYNLRQDGRWMEDTGLNLFNLYV